MCAADVTTFGGSVVVEDRERWARDATSFGGDVRLDKGVDAFMATLPCSAARIRRDPEASVAAMSPTSAARSGSFLIFWPPFVILGAFVALIVWIDSAVCTRPHRSRSLA